MPKKFTDRENTGGEPFRKERDAMKAILSDLEKTANRLNDTADQANTLIQDTNERLQELGAGVEYWPPVSARDREFVLRTDGTEKEFSQHVLGYTKLHGAWQLCVQEQHFVESRPEALVNTHDLEFTEEEPLLSAEREIRIKAARKLPKFLKAYTEHIKTLADGLQTDTEEKEGK
jgi:hypothetical protein